MRALLNLLCGAVVICVAYATCVAHPATSRPMLPERLAFEPTDGDVRFLARARGYSAAISANHASIRVQDAEVQIRFLHSRPARLEGAGRLPGVVNYLLGSDPGHWLRG